MKIVEECYFCSLIRTSPNGIDLNLVLVCDGKETTQRLSAKTAEELVKQIVEFVNRYPPP